MSCRPTREECYRLVRSLLNRGCLDVQADESPREDFQSKSFVLDLKLLWTAITEVAEATSKGVRYVRDEFRSTNTLNYKNHLVRSQRMQLLTQSIHRTELVRNRSLDLVGCKLKEFWMAKWSYQATEHECWWKGEEQEQGNRNHYHHPLTELSQQAEIRRQCAYNGVVTEK